MQSEAIRGAIDFKDVVFRYPTREGRLIFNGFDLSITPGKKTSFAPSAHRPSNRVALISIGQSLAIVGESGSGKR